MPHPTREARIARHIAVLDLYDEIRKGGDVPSVADVMARLKINEQDAGLLRRHIAVERCGRPVVRRKPWYWDVGTGQLPPRPAGLTRTEQAVWGVFAISMGTPMKPLDIHAQANGIPQADADAKIARVHIANMRAKGVRIGHSWKWGYWLELDPLQEVAS